MKDEESETGRSGHATPGYGQGKVMIWSHSIHIRLAWDQQRQSAIASVEGQDKQVSSRIKYVNAGRGKKLGTMSCLTIGDGRGTGGAGSVKRISIILMDGRSG